MFLFYFIIFIVYAFVHFFSKNVSFLLYSFYCVRTWTYKLSISFFCCQTLHVKDGVVCVLFFQDWFVLDPTCISCSVSIMIWGYLHDWVVFGSIMLWSTSMIELFLALYHALYLKDWVVFGSIVIWGTSMIEWFLALSCSGVPPWFNGFWLYHALGYLYDCVVFGSIMLWVTFMIVLFLALSCSGGTSMIELFLDLSCCGVPPSLSCFWLYHAMRYLHDWVVFGFIMLWCTFRIELFLAPSCYLQCISKLSFWLPYRYCITRVKSVCYTCKALYLQNGVIGGPYEDPVWLLLVTSFERFDDQSPVRITKVNTYYN
jgi:hypothetical protein